MRSAREVAGLGERTFVEVYEARYDQLVSVARLTTGSYAIAEELVQEAFAELYRRFDAVRRPDAYVQRAVVSRCTSWVRRRVTERRYLDRHGSGRGSEVDGGVAAEPVWSTDAATVEVIEALQTLPSRQRAVVVLRYLADWSEVEAAQALGMRPTAVRSLLARARARLVKELS